MLRRMVVVLSVAVFTASLATFALADTPKNAADKVICPVMGREVKDPSKAPKSEYKGQTYYFCCPSCKEKFDKDPEKYIHKAGGQSSGEGHSQTCGGPAGCGHQGH